MFGGELRSDRNILILGVLLLVLIAAAFWFFLLSPLRQNVAAAKQERSTKEAKLQNLNNQIKDLEAVKRDAPNIQRQLLELSKRVPEQDEIPSLVIQMEEIATEAGVVQLSVQPDSPEAPPGGGNFSRIPLKLSFEGSYEQMQDFLFRLKNLARLVTVNEVQYKPVEQTQGGGAVAAPGRTLLVDITAETYVQPAAKPVPTTPPPQPPKPATTQSTTTTTTTSGGTTGVTNSSR